MGEEEGVGQIQVKTPYMPPPTKTTQQAKNPKKGRQQDFDHHLKAQLAHSISTSVTSSFVVVLGGGLKRRFDMLALGRESQTTDCKDAVVSGQVKMGFFPS